MAEFLKQVPKWLFGLTLFVLALLLLLSLFIGQPFLIYGQEFGFRNRPVFLKGWTVTPETATLTQNTRVRLGVKTSEGICFLTAVRGAFFGGGQHAEVATDTDGTWYVQSISDLPTTGIESKARCLKLVEAASAPSS